MVVDLPWQVSPMIKTSPEPFLALEGETVGADARRVQVDRAVEGAVGDALGPGRFDHFEKFFQLFLGDRRIRHRHQALGLAQHQGAILVDDDVAEDQLRVQQVQNLFDQRAEHRVVFILDIGQGADLRGLVIFHLGVFSVVEQCSVRTIISRLPGRDGRKISVETQKIHLGTPPPRLRTNRLANPAQRRSIFTWQNHRRCP